MSVLGSSYLGALVLGTGMVSGSPGTLTEELVLCSSTLVSIPISVSTLVTIPVSTSTLVGMPISTSVQAYFNEFT